MPSLVVNVIGNTEPLEKSLKGAEAQMKRFAGRASSWDKRNPRTGVLEESFKSADAAIVKADEHLAGLGQTTDKVSKLGAARLGLLASAAVVGAQAVQRIQDGLKSSGEEALTSGGKWRNAVSSLLSLDAAGALLAFDLQRTTGSVEQLTQAINDDGVGISHHVGIVTRDIDAMAKLIGIDRQRERQLVRLTNLSKQYADAIDQQMIGALQRLEKQSIDTGSALVFGERGTLEGRGPGGIAGETPASKPGRSAEQRNRIFDNRISRELDRAQTSVPKLQKIAAEIKKRMEATKDATRYLTLEDALINVQRRIEASQTNAAKESARLAAERAAAEKARLAALKAAALARQQSRDDLALGLQTPGAANLRTQLAQLTSRSDIGSLSNKLAANLAGARRILNRSWKTISEDSRSNIAALFQTIRDELNKGTTGGPLTKTTQLSDNVLAGLGLSADQTRTLRARISHFNSAGVALAGAGGGTITVNTVVDGKVVAKVSSKYNGRTRSVNTTARNGPNAGGWTGRG